MLLSLSWLKDFVTIPKNITPQRLGELLTIHTVEVEDVAVIGEHLENIVVGKIISLKQHPNADRLQVVMVDDGAGKKQVVCGGSNLYEGMLVAFARVGARVRWHGQGELVTLEPAQIRGVESAGMICAAAEIGLEGMFPTSDERAVVDLPKQMKVGMLLQRALQLNDVIYDIDNKSMTHRPDLWSHYGMARDIAAFLAVPLKPLKVKKLTAPKKPAVPLKVSVADKKWCYRYMAVAVEGVSVQPSPEWIQQRLLACGMRPINNIVDASNYVMLEMGQPTHAFDQKKLGTTIAVRTAKQNEIIVTLDGATRKLTSDMVVITDGKKPVAIAGVMGGKETEVDEQTTSIVIESATFDAVSVRKTSQALGLRSEASMRFEKSLDPTQCEIALSRIVELLQQTCPQARIASKVSDVYGAQVKPKAITVPLEWLLLRLGVTIDGPRIVMILKRLGFSVTKTAKALSVTPPTWRATKDVSIAEDILEEVARMYGYEHIQPQAPAVTLSIPLKNVLRSFVDGLKDVAAHGAGMTETMSYAFTNEEQLRSFGLDPANFIRIANPLTTDTTLLRQSIIPNLMQQVIVNQRFADSIALFEIASVFFNEAGPLYIDHTKKERVPLQEVRLALVYAADKGDVFFEVKGRLEYIARALNISTLAFRDGQHFLSSAADAMQSAVITLDGKQAGYCMVVSDTVSKRIGLKKRTAVIEIDVAALFAAARQAGVKQFVPKDKFPAVERDMAFVVDAQMRYTDIRDAIARFHPLIKRVELFDVYEGERIGTGKRSLAFHISFVDPTKTLTGEEVDAVQRQLAAYLAKTFKAQLRDF